MDPCLPVHTISIPACAAADPDVAAKTIALMQAIAAALGCNPAPPPAGDDSLDTGYTARRQDKP